MPSSGTQADTWDNDAWQTYVKLYQDTFEPDMRFPSPSLLATGYYNATDAAMLCLEATGGDLSGGQSAFRDCLTNLELDAPNGKITLDGNLATKMVKMVQGVNQTLGIDPAVFAEIGLPSRDIPECKSSYN